MKLRIKGNTIRFRLTQTEVDNLAAGSVEDKTQFPAGNALVYRIKSSEKFEISFNEGVVAISVPSAILKEWAATNQIEISNSFKLANTEQLEISIEKDFKCLTERPKEDESDMYPNPLEQHSKC
ncbi:MAG: hypothetical protein L3J06_04215 [Cyclobacteriaceae bacterium]|nr:hypothetical protein [Cyclobacteriaceae bacterium]